MSFATLLTNIVKIMGKYWQVFLVKGVSMTLLLSVLAVSFGTIIGSLLAVAKMSKFRVLRFFVSAFVEFIRGTPILLQLYIGYFVFPTMFPALNMSSFTCITIALIINSSAYVSEIVRSGVQAVDPGQMEAARSLGMNKRQAMMRVVYPQAIKNILPALGNEFIMVIKETSLASTFFIGDLMTSYLTVKGATYLSMECLVIVGAIYFVLTFVLSKGVSALERRLKTSD